MSSALLRFRRGTTANKGGTLTYGEPYVNITSNNIEIGGLTSDYLIPTLNHTNNGSLALTGNLTVYGSLTAAELHIQSITSSVLFSSGSTRFGDTLDDTHRFTGSVYITGSQTVIDGNLIVNGIFIGGSGSLDNAFSESIAGRATLLELTSSDFESRIDSLEVTVPDNTARISDLEISESFLHNTLGLKDLTPDEVTQLKNIDTSTISTAQWGYLGNLDQGLSTSNNVSFNTITASFARFTGDINVEGDVYARQFHTEFTSASIIYSSGSTKFGDTADDTHQFTGSVNISGSLTAQTFIGDGTGITGVSATNVEYTNVLNKPTLVSGSSQISYNGITDIPTDIVSGSSQISYTGISDVPTGIVSGSSQIDLSLAEGTASWADNSVTSSYVLNAVSASYAVTASYIEYTNVVNKPTLVSGSSQISYNGITDIPTGIVSGSSQIDLSLAEGTASWADNAVNALTSSYVLNAVSSSYSNFATTSSHALNVDSFETLQSVTDNGATTTNDIQISGSLYVSQSITAVSFIGSLYGTGSWSDNSVSASHALNADNSISASHALNSDNAISASHALNADNSISASHALNSDNTISSSYSDTAISASHALNTDNAISSSYAISSSFAQTTPTFETLQSVTDNGSVTTNGITVQSLIVSGTSQMLLPVTMSDNLYVVGNVEIGGNILSLDSTIKISSASIDSVEITPNNITLFDETGINPISIFNRGTLTTTFYGNLIAGNAGNSPTILNTDSSDTVPTFIPDQSNPSSGIGGQLGIISLITNGTNALRIDTNQNVSMSADLLVSGTITAQGYSGSGENLTLQYISSSQYRTIQHLQDIFHSTGHTIGGEISLSGSNHITVNSGSGFIRATDNDVDTLFFTDFIGTGSAYIPSGSVRYVGVDYNAGVPKVVLHTTYDWNFNTDFPLGNAVNEISGTIHVETSPHHVGDHAKFMIRRLYETMHAQRDERTGGLILGETGTRNVTVTAGALWERLTRFTINSIDTSGAGTFDLYYRNAFGGWKEITGSTQWPNTEYDDGTGTLASLNPAEYANLWVYLDLDGDLSIVYGQDTNTILANAKLEAPPATLPNRLTIQATLIGRIIFKDSDATATSIESVYGTTFQGAIVSDHGALSGLTDDDHTQYTRTDGTRTIDGNQIITGSLVVTGSVTATSFTGSFSGSFVGDGSGLTGIVGGLWTSSVDYISRNSDVQITGSLNISSSLYLPTLSNNQTVTSILGRDTNNQIVWRTAASLGGGGGDGLWETGSGTDIYYNGDVLVGGTTNPRSLFDVSGSSIFGITSADTHLFTGSVFISGNVTATSFTGSFSGSFEGDGSGLTGITADTATSASHAVNSDTAISASHALWADNSVTASYIDPSSFTIDSASYAITASYVDYPNIDNLPTLVSGSTQISYSGITDIPSGIVSSSTQVSNYNVFLEKLGDNVFSSSAQIDLSQAFETASWADNAVTASYIDPSSFVIDSASYATFAETASYVASASYVPTLQEVTDQGSVTTNDIQITGSLLTTGSLDVVGTVHFDFGEDTIFSGSQIGIGTTIPLANSRITLTTVGTTPNALVINNSTGTTNYGIYVQGAGGGRAFSINYQGNFEFGNAGARFGIHGGLGTYSSINDQQFQIDSDPAAISSGVTNHIWYHSTKLGDWTPTGGTTNYLALDPSNGYGGREYAPVTGDHTLNLIDISDFRIETNKGGGTYTGSITAINYNPTIISLDSATHRFIDATSGDVRLQDSNVQITGSLLTTGSLDVVGPLTATTKSFLIQHPTHPGKKLQYGVLEGPEHSVYYRGKLKDNNTIDLPEYWTKLVHEDSITVQLTPINKYQLLYVKEIKNNKVFIGKVGLGKIHCYYLIHAERKDTSKLKVEF